MVDRVVLRYVKWCVNYVNIFVLYSSSDSVLENYCTTTVPTIYCVDLYNVKLIYLLFPGILKLLMCLTFTFNIWVQNCFLINAYQN